MQISIILKGPKEFEEGADIIVTEAVDFIPHETIEQLVARLLFHDYMTATRRAYPNDENIKKKYEFKPWGAAHEQVIEVRLIREIL